MVKVEAYSELNIAIPEFINYLRENCPLAGEAKIRPRRDYSHVAETWYSDITYSGPEGESLLGGIRICKKKGLYDYCNNPSSIFIQIYRGVIPGRETFELYSLIDTEGHLLRKDPNLEIPVRR